MFCRHYLKIKISQYGNISIFQCRDCKLAFSSNLQKKINPNKLYKNYYKNEILTGRFKYGLENVIKLFRFFRAFKILTISPKTKKIIDIGSGRGYMLYFLKKYYRYTLTIGTQLDQKAYLFSKKNLKLNIFQKDFLGIPFKNETFDIVTMFHVLEHLQQPEQYLKKIYRVLNRRGKIVIEVPNYNSWTRLLTKQFWLGLDLKYHLNFFTASSLTKMLNRYHFKVLNIHTFSLEYSAFISAQSILSLITNSNQLIFYWLEGRKFSLNLIFHIPLFVLLFPICLIINLILFFSERGEVLLIIAQKY